MTSGASLAPAAPGPCLLRIGERVVVRTNGPPDAEYALFEIAEIELRASEHGRVREHGYQTTASQARARLTALGMTVAVAEEVGRAFQPVLADAYARGAGVRKVARYLGPAELFQADTFDDHVYAGVFLDLATLTRDLAFEHASATLQALYLATILAKEAGDTPVELVTEEHTRQAKPGARTYKRPVFAEVQRLLNALGGLAHRNPKPNIEGTLRHTALTEFLRDRADLASDEDERALYKSLEGAVTVREMPDKGPLASPELWALEMRLDRGDAPLVIEAVEEIERRQGRSPGAAYLRARALLALRLEPAQLLAERIAALSLSMPAFQELAVLAAEAWLEAGEPRRAIPYARDLVDKSGSDPVLVARAERLLARALDGGTPSMVPDKRRTVIDFEVSAPKPSRPIAETWSAPPPDVGPRPARRSLSPPSMPPSTATAPPPPPLQLEMPEIPAPTPLGPLDTTPKMPSVAPPSEAVRSSRRPRLGVLMETRPPPSYDPRAERDDDPPAPRSPSLAPDRRISVPAMPRTTPLPPRRTPPPEASAEAAADLARKIRSERPTIAEGDEEPTLVVKPRERPYMHGASLPPYQEESPPPLLPRAPLLPRLVSDELAEHLALPPGITGDQRPLDTPPTSVLEARIQFTLLARELGLDYRLKRGIELRADLTGIEAMQPVLLESFPEHVVRTQDEALEIRRHGALLSEILSRKLDAEWLDITPPDLGYWVMIVPPNTRVWPFGRIARFIEMGHRERDLVSYFLELQARARPR